MHCLSLERACCLVGANAVLFLIAQLGSAQIEKEAKKKRKPTGMFNMRLHTNTLDLKVCLLQRIYSK